MKHFRICMLILVLMGSINTYAQQTAPKGTASATKKDKKGTKKPDILNNISVSLGGGTSNYFGDLMRYNVNFRQTSFSFSAGIVYELLPQLNARVDFGFQKLQGADSKKGGAFKNRNLSFKSNNFDISAALEFDFFNLHKQLLIEQCNSYPYDLDCHESVLKDFLGKGLLLEFHFRDKQILLLSGFGHPIML